MALFSSATKMKTLGEQAGFTIMELGDLFYLMLPKDPANRAVISAHGGHAVLSRTNSFTVPPDTILRFYSDDTYSVLDPGFNNFYQQEAAPKEVVSEGEQCFDYILTKYQGRHGNKTETYESIADMINDTARLSKVLNQSASVSPTAKARQAFRQAAAREKLAAVVTVRNRWFKGEATLSMLLREVKQAAPSLILFDCLFCRSTLFGGSQAVNLVSR